ncbi:3-hydroxyacyl-CoA dehydrogenase family protein [Streptomyces capitiformicae]|uniref:3-hydroxyacyl-CoA dehydrogenase family protein n=1 Tax=Streptomyces capitiformicae TaxID=2014920 RepID=UPI0035716820
MGPLRLLDLIGLDTAQAVVESLYEEHAEPLCAPSPLAASHGRGGAPRQEVGAGVLRVPGLVTS